MHRLITYSNFKMRVGAQYVVPLRVWSIHMRQGAGEKVQTLPLVGKSSSAPILRGLRATPASGVLFLPCFFRVLTSALRY
jgi:hypothetical protein